MKQFTEYSANSHVSDHKAFWKNPTVSVCLFSASVTPWQNPSCTNSCCIYFMPLDLDSGIGYTEQNRSLGLSSDDTFTKLMIAEYQSVHQNTGTSNSCRHHAEVK